jgi:hypothetical protein
VHLIINVHHFPVPLHPLIPRAPDVLAASDASKMGMGGFWVTHHPVQIEEVQGYLWHSPIPLDVQDQLVSIHNPQGSLTNSNLELMALLLTAILAQTTMSKPHPNIVVASDNIPAISWVRKGTTTSVKAPAYLLQLLAAARHAAPFSLTSVYTPVVSNKLADCCSCTATLLDLAF